MSGMESTDGRLANEFEECVDALIESSDMRIARNPFGIIQV